MTVSRFDYTVRAAAGVAVGTPDQVNLVPTPSFEHGLGAWVESAEGAYPGSISLGTTGWVGTRSLRLNGPSYVGVESTTRIPVTPGARYRLSAYAMFSTQTGFTRGSGDLSLALRDSNDASLGSIIWDAHAVAPGTWVYDSWYIDIPAGVTYVTLRAYAGDSIPNGHYAQIDGIMLEKFEGTEWYYPEIDYFDGDTPDTNEYRYSWTGLPGASRSTRAPVKQLPPVHPLDGNITCDESWSPYMTGNMTIPLPADQALIDAFDPRKGGRVQIRMSQQFGSQFELSKLTFGQSQYGDPVVLSEWTSSLNGAPLSTWTGRFGSPYNSFGPRASRVRTFDLGVRLCAVHRAEGTMDLTFASDEALLQDMGNLGTTALMPATNTALGAVQLALDSIGAAVVLEVADVALEPDSVAWEPGVSAWDYVSTLVSAAGLRLYCDEKRIWHLTQPNMLNGDRLVFTASTATTITDTISRDDDWYDAVHVTYRWTDSSGTEQVRYDTAQYPDYSRVLKVEFNRPFPRPGAAASILGRSRARGRIDQVSAVADPTATPGRPLVVSAPGMPTQIGYTSQVQFLLGEDLMQVRSRDLAEATSNAWMLVPDGVAWVDVPDGTSWDEFSITDLIDSE